MRRHALTAAVALFVAGIAIAATQRYDSDALFTGKVTTAGKMIFDSKVVSLPDSPNPDDGGAAATTAYTLVPRWGFVELACGDTDGCPITLSESGAEDGTVVRITNTSSNACTFADTSGVTELAGAFTMGQWDVLELVYANDRWVELGRSNN